MSTVRIALACLLVVLPSRLRRIVATLALKWDVHPSASIGRSFVLVDRVSLGPGARIGALNMIKGLSELRLGADASIGVMNWISGPPQGADVFPNSPNRYPALIMGADSAVVNRHFIDCSDTVTLEDFAILSGVRSTVFTHSVDLVRCQQRAKRVTIGERSAVLSNSIVLSGTAVAPRSIVSAGSVVNTVLTKEHVLYRGNPAVEIRELPAELPFFHRAQQKID